jgi:2-polyprenyl-3-methyl-5-hydroxy-6-metoxy-1,4-benzoquinol methylase
MKGDVMNKGFKVINDPEYGFLRADPIPTKEEVEKFYKEDFYSSEYRYFNDSAYEVQLEEKEFNETRWESIYKNIVDFFGRCEDISLFDIGCGFALALQYFREKGLKVGGMDPAPEAVEYAKKKNIDVRLAGIEDFECIESQQFDVVTIMNTLEHLRKPADTLFNIKRYLLKDEGLLVIDVPNEFNDFQIVANKEFELGEWWVCPPNHINYFSVSSLKDVLQKCGYVIVNYESSFPLELFLLMGEVYVGDTDLGKKCHNKRVMFEQLMRKHGKAKKLNQFYKALADCDLGRQIILYATPK